MLREGLNFTSYLLLVSLVSPLIFVLAEITCDSRPPITNLHYSQLFSKFEEALINNQTVLDLVRHAFMSVELFSIGVNIHLEVVNVTADLPNCEDYTHYDDSWYSFTTFCPSNHSAYKWTLCNIPGYYYSNEGLRFSFMSQSSTDRLSFNKNYFTEVAIQWLSLIHGGVLSVILPNYFLPELEGDYNYYNYGYNDGVVDLTLVLDGIDCNPSFPLTICTLSEFVSWFHVYSEGEEYKQQSWDQNQKGTVVHGAYYGYDYDYEADINFVWPVTNSDYVKLGLSEYVIVSLSLALIIAKFFPVVHNKLINNSNMITRPEHQSVYWGTVVVSNILTYGLLFAAMRGWSVSLGIMVLRNFDINYDSVLSMEISVLTIQYFLVHGVLLFGAIISSYKQNHKSCTLTNQVPFPSKMGKIIFYITLLWSWVIYYFRMLWNKKLTERGLRIAVMYSLMNFIHCSTMDILSIMFILFIEDARSRVITLTLLYSSFIVFLALFTSFSFLNVSGSININIGKKVTKWFGGGFIFVTVFAAVVLLVVMYMIIVISLDLKGITGIVTGLIPSIALSAGSWYIKKRLEKGLSQSSPTTDLPATEVEMAGVTVNDGERVTGEDSIVKCIPLLQQ